MIHVELFDEQSDLLIDSESVKNLICECFRFSQEPAAEIGVYFVSDEKMCAIHEEYFGDPSSTDCMTFPVDPKEEPNRYIGDIIICPQTALRYAKKHNIDVYEETSLYIVHAILHLLGFNDIEEEEQKQMRQEEERYLSHLREKGLLLTKRETIA
jgi:probable rRNA maturation factor